MNPTEDRPEGEHPKEKETALARRKRTPMWGCVRAIFWGSIVLFIVLFLLIWGGWKYLGSSSFAELVRLRIERNLESHLGRDVYIGSVEIIRSRPAKVIIKDIRVANAKGALQPWFATVREVDITGGVDSFWNRRIKLGRVDVKDPRINFEVFPEGFPLVHNFPHWKPSAPRKYEITRLDVSHLYVTGGAFDFNDRRHEITALTTGLAADVVPRIRESRYEGVATSNSVVIRIQDYEPIVTDLRGGFVYVPGALGLKSIALRGRGLEAFLSGEIKPLTDGVYNLNLVARTDLAFVRDVFRVEKALKGTLALNGTLKGRQGDFRLAGAFRVPQMTADAYDLSAVAGKLDVDANRTVVDITSGRYGGGNIAAHYILSKYAEPYPMSVDLRYDRISIEKLFADWTVKNTGLRGSATGRLRYAWNKDKVLEGHGSGTATLAKGAVAFGNAKYPVPISGVTDFALDAGTIHFDRASFDTPKSHVDLAGTLRIDDLFAKLNVAIRSSDFAELDRIAYNFAHSFDKKDFELLGFGGSGTIKGTVTGKLEEPEVVASVSGSNTKYANVELGDSTIDLRYHGKKSVLTFDNAEFRLNGGLMTLKGDIRFPDRGPSPVFDLQLSAHGYDVERALKVVDLKLGITGNATGNMIVTGTPDEGNVRFSNMDIAGERSHLHLNGLVAWRPGKGNVRFDLDIGADSVPVKEIIAFLELGDLPLTGEVTGTLHIEGEKSALEGAGAVQLRNGSIAGEPIDLATADLLFTKGKMRATNLEVRAPAGVITGEAEVDLTNERFSYVLNPSRIDLSKLKTFKPFGGIVSGIVNVTSSGAGTFKQPEIVLEASLENGVIRGVNLPAGTENPKIYLAIRNGELVVRGSAADVFNVDGHGFVAADGTLSGSVQITVADVARAMQLFAPGVDFPASGNLVVDLQLGGKISPLEAVRIDGTIPTMNLKVADQDLTLAKPAAFSLRNGRIVFESFDVAVDHSDFSIAGSVGLTGDQTIDLQARGLVQAAVLQLFTQDIKAQGNVRLDAGITGTLKQPLFNGVAEIQGAQFRFAGFPQPISDVRGTITLKGTSIGVGLNGVLGGGTVSVGGSIALEGLTPKSVGLSILGNGVALRYFTGVTVEGNFRLALNGDPAEHMLLNGEVTDVRALYYKDFDFATSLLNLVLERRGLLPAVAASWQDHVSLDITISAPDGLAVKNNIANVTGSANLDLRGTLANPVVLGEVAIDEGGKIRFQDVEYRVVRGSIVFQNPFRIDPYFDITAEGRLQDVDLTVNLTGTLDRINPVITSDPPVSDLTLLSLIGPGTFGPNTAGQSVFESMRSLSGAGTSLLVQSVGTLIGSKILPFADTFRLDLVEGLTDHPDPQATFEKRISNDVRAIVIYNLRSEKNVEIVEWQVTPDWVLQLTRDSEKGQTYLINAIDARFRRRYLGHWGGENNENDRVIRASNVQPDNAQQQPEPDQEPASAVPPANGDVVRTIRFDTDAQYDTGKLLDLVDVKPEKPLSIRDVQSSIKSLYATGDFRDIRVDETRNGLDVNLTFVLSLNYRIAKISFDGVNETKYRLVRLLSIRPDDVLSLNAVDKSAVAIQEELARQGFLESTVDPETQFDRVTNRVTVIFHVTLGPLAKIGGVNFEGSLEPFTAEQLATHMRGRVAKAFKSSNARGDAQRIQDYLVSKGYRKADVRYLGDTYDAATKTVLLRYRVTVGPTVRVEVLGVPKNEVKRLLPFRKDEAFSEDVIARATDRIIETYQQRGYFFVSVDTAENQNGNEDVVIFQITPGKQYKTGNVLFEGNTLLSDKKIKSVVGTGSGGFLRKTIATLLRRPQGVTQQELNDDRDAIETLYRIEGFAAARVESVRPVPNGDRLDFVFPITEGPRTLVTSVKIEGNEQVPVKNLPKPQLKSGDPLNPNVLATDIVALQTFYADRGNVEVQVTPAVDATPDHTGAAITYRIAEGPKVEVDDVIVRGNTYTKTNVILKKAGLQRGEPFTYRKLLEAQRDLYRLAIFQRVEVDSEKAGTTVSDRDVTVQVEEGKALTVAGALGYSTDEGARGSASISHRNLFGTARFLGLEALIAQRQDRYSLTYREPFIGPFDVPTQLTIFQSNETRTGLNIRRRGTFVEASRVVRERSRWSLHYEYRIVGVTCENSNDELCNRPGGIPIPGVPREDQAIDISSLTPTVFWDTRDDALDPHRGWFASSSLEYAFPFASAKTSFVKTFNQAAWYKPVTDRSLFAVSARVGLIKPINSAGGITGDDRLRVPFSERFTAGGDTSHRGFKFDMLGNLGELDPVTQTFPKDATLVRLENGDIVAIGGDAMMLVNAEYRFPIFGSLNGAVFTDIGNVWARISSMSLGGLRYGVGIGFRYLTPIGPIRFDLGFNPNAKPFEDRFIPFFTLGNSF